MSAQSQMEFVPGCAAGYQSEETKEGNMLVTHTHKQMHNKSQTAARILINRLTPDKNHHGAYLKKFIKKITHRDPCPYIINTSEIKQRATLRHYAWEKGGCHPQGKLSGDSSIPSLSILCLSPDACMSFRI
ncbi:hypothetical protein XENOCAPTIV_023557 [Xenoophorus captivus]|uniref:60S ribosomal protein L17 n=1 Tax=Xenoophorus captivus TaxID=1517983 RepID=A0ABV0S0E3_9TELE